MHGYAWCLFHLEYDDVDNAFQSIGDQGVLVLLFSSTESPFAASSSLSSDSSVASA